MGYYRRKPWRGGQAMGIAALAATLGSSSLTVCARAQAPEPAAGIRFLNRESRREAVECGRSGADCAVKPYRLCPQNQRFSAWIATPFSRIAASVFESLEKGERPKPWDAGEANAWGAGIYVYPSGDYSNADAIQSVVIRRAGQSIQPATTTIAPVTVTGPDGTQKQLSKGFFAFPRDVFSPDSESAIVLTGAAGEMTCTLDPQQLSALR